jgi:hypothetical protein
MKHGQPHLLHAHALRRKVIEEPRHRRVAGQGQVRLSLPFLTVSF